MKSLVASALALSLSTANAGVFSIQDEKVAGKTYLKVTRPFANALADETLMGKIVRDAHATLVKKVYELNAKVPMPEQIWNSDDMERFKVRKDTMDKFIGKVNEMLAPVREAQIKNGDFNKADLIPDAFVFYFPLLKVPKKIGPVEVDQFAVVISYVKDQTYEISQDPACKDMKIEDIKAELKKAEVDKVGDCKVTLVEETHRTDKALYWMAGLDRSWFGIDSTHPRSAGFGFIWDMKNQMSSADDVLGFYPSISLGKVGVFGVDLLSNLYTKIMSKLPFKKVTGQLETTMARSAVQESIGINIPGGLDLAAMVKVVKNVNNYRIGGIFNENKFADGNLWPDYFVLTVDIAGKSLQEVFKMALEKKEGELDETDSDPVNKLKGKHVTFSAFGLAPAGTLIDLAKEFFSKAQATDKKSRPDDR